MGFGGARTLTATLLDNFGAFNVDASLTSNTSIDQRGILNVAATRTLTISAARVLTLYPGSTTTVTGNINNIGSCINLGGTLSGTYSCP